ncbi:sensor histidine kinase [Rugamonas sp.]|uniref:sensor histidine kinase n=1 Tax=Rugamonas sp. TaxID=1926287 RepID=UPI0025FD4A58|nr:sensor histidine kinase [Rugamonas sp.]
MHIFAAMPPRKTGRPALALCFILLMACCRPAAHAATPSPDTSPIDLQHTSWTIRDGAPPVVLTMAQTTDGWLWLGASSGLFRFDGVRFERYQLDERDERDERGNRRAAPLPATAISILSAQPSGALWIGYRFGGASLLRAGRLRNYDQRDGLPDNAPVWGLEPDASGRVWAATSVGMYHLDGERWLAAAPSWGLPLSYFKTLMRDRHHVLWAQGELGVYSLAPGAQRFRKASPDSGTGVLFEVPDGSVWSWDARHNQLHRLTAADRGAPGRQWRLRGDVASLAFDRRGDLWVGRQAGLEYHTDHGVARTGPHQGLSGNAVGAILEDREGNIWAATTNGIDRFRSKQLSEVTIPDNGGRTPLAADAEGGAWLGRFHATGSDPAVVTALWPRAAIPWHNLMTCAYRAPDGVLWVGGYGGLWRKQGGRPRRIALPSGVEGGQINSLVQDHDGGLWAAIATRGLYRLDPRGGWEKRGGKDGLPEEAPRSMAGDDGGLWFAYPHNRLLQREHGRWRDWGAADGLAIGMTMALHLHGDHVWAGGENGLALRQGSRFVAVTGVGGQAFPGISGVVELDNGDVWLNGGAGLYRIAAGEIARLARDAGYRVRYQGLDSADGLEGNAPLLLPTPSLVQATDHRLWVSTTAGVFRFDPSLRPAVAPAAPVLIRSVSVQGQERAPVAGMRLPPGTDTLQITYTALALAMPERVGFRYRLDGVDRYWQDAGHRRAAYYHNLGPGDYRFEVLSSSYDGVWGGQPATLAFSVAPTLVQTWWFRSLGAMALLAAGWMGYRWRIRRLVHQMVLRLEARLDERERIARELHDSFLQSVHALMLNVNAAVLRLPTPEPARVMIDKALQQAGDVLREGRAKVRGLRSGAGTADLAAALRMAGDHLRPPNGAALQLQVEGKVRGLHRLVQEETLAIANEAIANAYRHARAARIVVELHYHPDELRLAVRDDGIGVPPDVMAAGGRQDHWGFPGMRERALRIKARLVLSSADQAGTTWTMTLPAALAYETAARRYAARNA